MAVQVGAILPLVGTGAGGTAVTIYGSGFASGATVTIGGNAATSVVVADSQHITCVTPAGITDPPLVVGMDKPSMLSGKDVVVTNTDTSTATLARGYEYTGFFTDADVAKVCQVFRMPRSGRSLITLTLVHWPYSNIEIWQPTWNRGNMTGLVLAMGNSMGLTATEDYALCQALMTQFDDIGATSPMRLTKSSSGVEGPAVIDDPEELENVRQLLANQMGMHVPRGGFLREVLKTYGEPSDNLGGPLGGGNYR